MLDNALRAGLGIRLHHFELDPQKLARLEEAPCHTEPLDERDVEAYIDALSELWPDPDWADIEIDAQRSRSLSSHLGYGGQVNAVPLSCSA